MDLKQDTFKFVNIRNVQINYNDKLYNIVYNANNNSIILESKNTNIKLETKIDNLNYIYQVDSDNFILSKKENKYKSSFEHIEFVDGIFHTKFYHICKTNSHKHVHILDDVYLLKIDSYNHLLYNYKTRKIRTISNASFIVDKNVSYNNNTIICVKQKINYKKISDTLYFNIDSSSLENIDDIYSELQDKTIKIYKENEINKAIKDDYENRLSLTYIDKIYKPLMSLHRQKEKVYQKVYK